MTTRDRFITGSYAIGENGKEPLDWKEYALKLEDYIEGLKDKTKPIIMARLRNLEQQVFDEKISYSRMVEILNEETREYYDNM